VSTVTIFRFPVPSRIAVLILIDYIVSWVVFITTTTHFSIGSFQLVLLSILIPAIVLVSIQCVGGYEQRSIHRLSRALQIAVFSTLIFSVVVLFVLRVILRYEFTIVQFLSVSALLAISLFLCRLIISRVIWPRMRTARILILGAGWAGREIAGEIKKRNGIGIELIGCVDDFVSQSEIEGCPVVGTFDELRDIIESHKPDIAIMAITHNRPIHILNAEWELRRLGIPVIEMARYYEQVAQKTPIQHIGPNVNIIPSLYRSLNSGLWDVANRIFNIAGSLLLLVALAPLLMIVAIAVKLDSRGPIIYSQKRVGFRNREFLVYKFRSMIHNAESENGPVWAQRDDPRITRIGKIMRTFRLDELPQLLNVVKGDMNLVGPRPERPKFVTDLEEEVPFYSYRHVVRPGITGWAQVNYRYGNCTEDAINKLQYDLFYISRRSFFLEFLIIMKTIAVVIGRKGY